MGEGADTETFCIRCGSNQPIAQGYCAACIREEVDPLKGPDAPIRLERCTHCGTFESGYGIEDAQTLAEAVERAAVGSVRVAEELDDVEIGVRTHRKDPTSFEVLVELAGRFAGEVPVEDEQQVRVDVARISCEACSRRHGGYYEAIVQVRYEGEQQVSDDQAIEIAEIIEEEVRRAGGLSGGTAYLLKATPRHGGYDYYFGAKPVARAVASRIADAYGGNKTRSTTLAGRKDGEDFHRLTIAVRIPRVRPGSVIGFEDEVIRVHQRHGNRLVGKTVPDGQGRTIEQRDTDRAEVLDPQLTEVVYQEGGEGQVLDPQTLDSVQVALPRGVEAGDEVETVRYRGRLVVLGEPWESAESR